MKKRIILTFAAILAMAANTYAADTPAAATAPATANEAKPAAPANDGAAQEKTVANPMADLEYSDAKECHFKTPDGGKPLPVIHALLASRGMNSNNQTQHYEIGRASCRERV